MLIMLTSQDGQSCQGGQGDQDGQGRQVQGQGQVVRDSNMAVSE